MGRARVSPKSLEGSYSVASTTGSLGFGQAWFGDFLASRGSAKRSPHTLIAWRQDVTAIATLITAGRPQLLAPADITRRSLQQAFAAYAATRAHSTVQRCWATWNAVCGYLHLEDLIPDNPMPHVARPRVDTDATPKALPGDTVAALVGAVSAPPKHRATDWDERDLAIVMTGLLTGLRSAELCAVNIGDVWRTDDGAGAVRVRHGKGNKERVVPIEAALLAVIDDYLDSRATRFPRPRQRGRGLAGWPHSAAAVRRTRRATTHPRHPAIPAAPGVSAHRPTRQPPTRRPGAQPAAHVRHRTGQIRCQRLHPDEPARPQIDGHLATLRHRRRHPDPHRRSSKSLVPLTQRPEPRRYRLIRGPVSQVRILPGTTAGHLC